MLPADRYNVLLWRLDNFRAHCRNIAAGLREGTSAPSEITTRGPKLASWWLAIERLAVPPDEDSRQAFSAYNAEQPRDLLAEYAALKPLAASAETLLKASFTEPRTVDEQPVASDEPRAVALAAELDKAVR